jgi:hypothetical protein
MKVESELEISGQAPKELMVRYRRALRRQHLKQMLPWARFQFGARWHRFSVGPPASAQSLSDFEERWRVSLPGSYRACLQGVGNGFGGPFYGIAPLEEWCAPEEERDLPADFLLTPFAPDAARVLQLLPGALRVCNVGCEHYYLLVVSGPHRGELWHDGGAHDVELRKLEVKGEGDPFAAWLEAWLGWISARRLEQELVSDGFWAGARYPGHAVAQTIDDLSERSPGGGGVVATEQLPCPACVSRLIAASVSRLVVPALANEKRNPNLVTRAAARNACTAVALRVYP